MLITPFSYKIIKLYLLIVLKLVNKVLCENNSHRSFGGYKVDIADFPYIVMVLHKITETRAGKCTGTIINENWVLSAAHCVIGFANVNNVKIIAGIDDIENMDKSQNLTADEIILHTLWDVALIKVEELDFTKENVAILPLGADIWPQDYRMYNRRCLAVGWGLPNNKVNDNWKLHATNVIAQHGQSQSVCECIFRSYKLRTICLKRETNKGICTGDSGGPLVCDGKTYGIAHIIYDISICNAIYSLNPICGAATTVSVYLYVCPLLNWIKRIVKTTPSKPPSCHANIRYTPNVMILILCVLMITKLKIN